ncbi:outer membrane beta-barrel protein [Roseibium sp.]|uniref:outer membrane beta-barrel protein n=1 Tax=Roseibium sp. TaxID=1936156 RepID=UPI003A96DAA0
MFRHTFFLAGALSVLSVPSWSQDLGDDLRGGVYDAEDTSVVAEEPANARRNPTSSPVYSLRGLSNEAVAEEGSTGLGSAGRVEPVRPFSDRVQAVRALGGAGSVLSSDGAFAGDTRFDEASGIRVGTFTILPELTVTGGWTDNTAQSVGGTSGTLYRIAPSITATSDWSRHQLGFALRGSYVAYPDDRSDDDQSVSASTALRLDLNSRTTANGALAYTFSQEDASSAEAGGSSDDIHQVSGSLGITRDAGIVAVTLRGGLDRNIYSADNGGSSSSSRDNTLYSAALRVDANPGAVFSPFAEGALLLRRYDRSCSDAICEKRDANGYQMRGGIAISSGPKLAGEVGAGWRVEDLEDERLDALSGVVVDASLVWSPTRLTTVTGGLGTRFETTDIDGASGSIIYSGDVRIAHEFTDRLVGEAGAGYSYRTYQGASIEEKTLTGLLGATFALTRNAALQTRYTYRRFEGESSGSDYDQSTIEAGVRFRH